MILKRRSKTPFTDVLISIAAFYYFFLFDKYFIEPSKLNDLENIQETDTPPQSPKNQNETIKVSIGSSGNTVHFKKADKVSPIREQVIEEALEQTPKRHITRTRKPRRLVEYNEPNMEMVNNVSSD